MILQAKHDIAKALRVFTVPEHFPVLVHCIHGKDRTGLIIMLIMLLCSIPAEVSCPAPQSILRPASFQLHRPEWSPSYCAHPLLCASDCVGHGTMVLCTVACNLVHPYQRCCASTRLDHGARCCRQGVMSCAWCQSGSSTGIRPVLTNPHGLQTIIMDYVQSEVRLKEGRDRKELEGVLAGQHSLSSLPPPSAWEGGV